jgi:diaminohydroxyphosphoribosylaminopyrimidine deaminase / 5-amino-6-(5-phosphoribosylamino)uracil reductase
VRGTLILMEHASFMYRTLELAVIARGRTGINPLVGSVLVRDGKIIAEGFHSEYGKPHAELTLLQKFEQEIRSNDTLYVNLEPCCHTEKKTPPCAKLLVDRGVKRVVFGMIDPNPHVAGKGIAFLRSHGVECTGPVLLADFQRLNRGFISLMTRGRPWVTLKSARAQDGTISNPDGSPKRITSVAQDVWSHEFLRARHDAILVGVGTILCDDPELTVRHLTPSAIGGHPSPLQRRGDGGEAPWRIVLDPHGKIPMTSKVVNDELARKTIVIRRDTEGAEGAEAELRKRGVRVLKIPFTHEALEWTALWKALTTPADDFYGISSILVEGGRRTWESFKKAGMMDEEVVLIGK